VTIRMGYWDCPSCGHKRVEGVQAACPQCGRPRGPGIQFYTDANSPEIQDPELLARARAGSDWQCKFCGADNRAGQTECRQCGASADGMRTREQRTIMNPTPPPKGVSGAVIAAIVAALVGVGVLVWFLFLRTKALEVTVAAATWTKAVVVERLTMERNEAFADEVPKDARELGRTTKQRTKKVQDGVTKVKVGQKDLGNGTFEDIFKEEPKYVEKKVQEPWVTYEVERWKPDPAVTKETTDGSEPPEPNVLTGGRSRVGSKSNKLVLDLKGSDSKKYSFEIDLASEKNPKDVVSKYSKGTTFTAMVTATGSVRELK
jgi:hypothetical protein